MKVARSSIPSSRSSSSSSSSSSASFSSSSSSLLRRSSSSSSSFSSATTSSRMREANVRKTAKEITRFCRCHSPPTTPGFGISTSSLTSLNVVPLTSLSSRNFSKTATTTTAAATTTATKTAARTLSTSSTKKASSPTSRITTIDNKWYDQTRRFLHPKRLEDDVKQIKNNTQQNNEQQKQQLWTETLELLTYWVGKKQYKGSNAKHLPVDNLTLCFQILDQFKHRIRNIRNNELSTTSSSSLSSSSTLQEKSYVLPTSLTNSILNAWRIEFKQSITGQKQQHQQQNKLNRNLDNYHEKGHTDQVNPKQILSTLSSNSTFARSSSSSTSSPVNIVVPLNSKSHGMILDAASTWCQAEPKVGIGFIEEYMEDWQHAYRRQQDERKQQQSNHAGPKNVKYDNETNNGNDSIDIIPPIDVVAIGSILHAYANSGISNALEKIEYWMTNKLPEFNLRPNNYLYNTIITMYARELGQPYQAQELLKQQIEMATMTTDTTDLMMPDVPTWNSVLSGWSRYKTTNNNMKQKKQPRRNQRRPYERIEEKQSDYNPAEEADRLLQQMKEMYYQKGILADPPDIYSYTLVMNCWSQQSTLTAATRAHGLLEELKALDVEERQENQTSLVSTTGAAAAKMSTGTVARPNTVAYNTVIAAYARANCPNEAEDLLMEMIELDDNQQRLQTGSDTTKFDGMNGSDRSGSRVSESYNTSTMTTPVVQPDLYSFSSVISAWSRVGTVEGAQRAETLLRDIMPMVDLTPNVECYTSCIMAWANALLFKKNNSNGNNDNTNNGIKKNHAFDRMGNRGQDHEEEEIRMMALQRGKALFYEMQCIDDESAFVNLDTGIDVEKLTTKPKMMSSSSKDVLIPDTYTYTAMINLLGRSGAHPLEAQRLLEELCTRYSEDVGRHEKEGNNGGGVGGGARTTRTMSKFQPNIHIVTSVLSAWCKYAIHHYKNMKDDNDHYEGVGYANVDSNDDDDDDMPSSPIDKAEEFLKQIRTKFRRHNIRPNIFSYAIVLDAWAKISSTRTDAPDRARQLLQEMEEILIMQPGETRQQGRRHPHRQQNHQQEEKAVVAYSSVLQAYAEQGRAEEAEDLLQQMIEKSYLPNPDGHAFGSVLYAWSKHYLQRQQRQDAGDDDDHDDNDDGSFAAERAEAILTKMIQLHNDYNDKSNRRDFKASRSSSPPPSSSSDSALVLKEAPSFICYIHVLSCWANSTSRDAAHRAERLFRAMQGHEHLSFNNIALNKTLQTWLNQATYHRNFIRDGQQRAGQQNESFLSNDEDDVVVVVGSSPHHGEYQQAIVEAARRAQTLLEEIEQQSSASQQDGGRVQKRPQRQKHQRRPHNQRSQPNFKSYEIVFQALQCASPYFCNGTSQRQEQRIVMTGNDSNRETDYNGGQNIHVHGNDSQNEMSERMQRLIDSMHRMGLHPSREMMNTLNGQK